GHCPADRLALRPRFPGGFLAWGAPTALAPLCWSGRPLGAPRCGNAPSFHPGRGTQCGLWLRGEPTAALRSATARRDPLLSPVAAVAEAALLRFLGLAAGDEFPGRTDSRFDRAGPSRGDGVVPVPLAGAGVSRGVVFRHSGPHFEYHADRRCRF